MKNRLSDAHLQKWILSRATGFKRRVNPKQATMKTPVFSDDMLLNRMLLLAALAIVMMGIHLAASILSIILLSLFLAIVLEPVVALLCRTRLPRSLVVVLLGGVLLMLLVYVLLRMVAALPELNQMSLQMRSLLTRQLAVGMAPLQELGLTLSPEAAMSLIDPGQFLGLITRMLSNVSSFFSSTLVVFLTVIFMLIEVPVLVEKTQRLFRAESSGMKAVRRGIDSVTQYLMLKTLMSVLNGVATWVLLTILQVKFAFIWAVLAFLLNFIPALGSILAAVPPIIQAFAFNGMSPGMAALAAFLIINLILGWIVDPYLCGRKLNIATSVVLISLLVWQGLLGLIGILLAVPLTMTLKLIVEQVDGGARWARLLEGGKEN
ncbi:AI-2E family transporter [Symbiopectobacterium purcellii]|uniref:AI-2E family transporter n=1 Tax=Symbiopectobacterium purcellii TaxID=2871826 RepID=UPI003F830406